MSIYNELPRELLYCAVSLPHLQKGKRPIELLWALCSTYLILRHFELDDNRRAQVGHFHISEAGREHRTALGYDLSSGRHWRVPVGLLVHLMALFRREPILAHFNLSEFGREQRAGFEVHDDHCDVLGSVCRNCGAWNAHWSIPTTQTAPSSSVGRVEINFVFLCRDRCHVAFVERFLELVCVHGNVWCSFAEFSSFVDVVLKDFDKSEKIMKLLPGYIKKRPHARGK